MDPAGGLDERHPFSAAFGGLDRPYGAYGDGPGMFGRPRDAHELGMPPMDAGLFDAQPAEAFRPREPQPADMQLSMLQELIDADEAIVEVVEAAEGRPAEIEVPPDAEEPPRRDSASGSEDNDEDMADMVDEEGSGSESSGADQEPNQPNPPPGHAVFQQMLGAIDPGANAALPPPPNPQPAPAGGDQALLSSFFGSLNQPPAPQQPPQPELQQPVQPLPIPAAAEEAKQEEPAQAEPVEAQPAEEQKEEQKDNEEPSPVAQEGSSLLPGAGANPAEESNLLAEQPQPVAAPEEAKAEEVKAEENQAAQEEEAMTFGYPNSLLLANDIEPAVLESLPEELRVEVLSQI
jgi:hypothetical protein